MELLVVSITVLISGILIGYLMGTKDAREYAEQVVSLTMREVENRRRMVADYRDLRRADVPSPSLSTTYRTDFVGQLGSRDVKFRTLWPYVESRFLPTSLQRVYLLRWIEDKSKYDVIACSKEWPSNHDYHRFRRAQYYFRNEHKDASVNVCGPYAFNQLLIDDMVLPPVFGKEILVGIDLPDFSLYDGDDAPQYRKSRLKRKRPLQLIDIVGWHPLDGA